MLERKVELMIQPTFEPSLINLLLWFGFDDTKIHLVGLDSTHEGWLIEAGYTPCKEATQCFVVYDKLRFNRDWLRPNTLIYTPARKWAIRCQRALSVNDYSSWYIDELTSTSLVPATKSVYHQRYSRFNTSQASRTRGWLSYLKSFPNLYRVCHD